MAYTKIPYCKIYSIFFTECILNTEIEFQKFNNL